MSRYDRCDGCGREKEQLSEPFWANVSFAFTKLVRTPKYAGIQGTWGLDFCSYTCVKQWAERKEREDV